MVLCEVFYIFPIAHATITPVAKHINSFLEYAPLKWD